MSKRFFQIVPFIIGLILVFGIRELMHREIIGPTLALVLLLVAIGFGYLAKRYIQHKHPELASPKENVDAELELHDVHSISCVRL